VAEEVVSEGAVVGVSAGGKAGDRERLQMGGAVARGAETACVAEEESMACVE
jgi:hypothetical protein